MARKRKRAWTVEEDEKLQMYVERYGIGLWDSVAKILDIGKSGNSCRLRWFNYLKPDIVRGKFTDEEILMILKRRYEGDGWSKIAKKLPGRTDNRIKNFWNTRMKKEAKKLKCDVKSEEFLIKMTAKLMERMQAPADQADPTVVVEGGDGAAATLVAFLFTAVSSDDEEECWNYSPTTYKESGDHGSTYGFWADLYRNPNHLDFP